jgi:hypothetical protein
MEPPAADPLREPQAEPAAASPAAAPAADEAAGVVGVSGACSISLPVPRPAGNARDDAVMDAADRCGVQPGQHLQ